MEAEGSASEDGPSSVPVKTDWDNVFRDQDRFQVVNATVFNADVRDLATGETYMARSTEQAREIADWANANWRTHSLEEVQLRLGAMDQTVRDIAGLAERDDVDHVRAYLARVEAEAKARTAEAEAARPVAPAPETASTTSTASGGSGPKKPAEPVPPSILVPEPATAPEPPRREISGAMQEVRTLEEAFNTSRKLGTEITRLRAQAETADRFMGEVSDARRAWTRADQSFQMHMRALYGPDTDAVLRRTPAGMPTGRRVQIARALRSDPASLGTLDEKWNPRIPRPSLKTELEGATTTAARAFDERDAAHRDYESACARAAIHYRDRLGPNPSYNDIVQAINSARADATDRMQDARTRLATQDMPSLRRDIQRHFDALTPAQQTTFLQRYPQWNKIVSGTAKSVSDAIDPDERGRSR